MKKLTIILSLLVFNNLVAQNAADILIPTGLAALTFIAIDSDKKEMAKEISQFRSKEYIMDYIIGPTNNKEIKFETESLAADNSAGLISVAFNCDEVNEKGLLLAFFGTNRNGDGTEGNAYGFRYIPLNEAQQLLKRMEGIKENHKDYTSKDNDVNKV